MSVVELGVCEIVVGEVGGAGCVDVECGKVEAAAGGETGEQGRGGGKVKADHCVDYD